MAITGIDTIDGKQIIAAGASSAVKAAQDSNGNNIASTYQTTAGMSNYQTTADMGDYATTADVTGKQDALTFNYNESDLITGINSSGIATGGSFPASADEACQVVTANSADWNEVSAIEKLYISGRPSEFSGALDFNYTNPSIIANPGGLTAGRSDIGQLIFNNSTGLSATGLNYNFGFNKNEITLSSYPLRLSANYNHILYSGIEKTFFSVGSNGVYFSGNDNNGDYITKLGSGISASIIGYDGIAISSKAYNGQTGSLNGIEVKWGPNLPSIRVSGQQSAVLDISYSGASYIDNNGNVKWKFDTPNIYCWNGANDTHNNMPILLGDSPITAASARNGRFLSASYAGIEIAYGPTAAPYLKLDAQSVKSYYPSRSAEFGMSQGFVFTTTSLTAKMWDAGVNITGGNGADVNIYNTATSARYTLTGSVQKREIEGDSATSAITAIAGSALTCELPADLVYTATLSATSALLNDDIQTVSAAIPVLSSLNTEGITDIQLVNELPVDPVSTVLYLIPEA